MNSASVSLLDGVRDSCAAKPAAADASPCPWPVAILGVPFDQVTIAGAIDRIDRMIAIGRPHYVVTANVDFLVQAGRDVELRRILLEADLVLCDGTPLLWASRWLGNALPERVAGSDLTPALLRSAAEKGHRVFLLGAAEGVAAEAEARLRNQFPTLNIVGHYAPPHSALLEMNHAEIVQHVRAAAPDILLVSFGCPKQEKWIAMHHRTLGVPVAIGVGATLDFLAGRVKRAPAWMRRTGLEWLYRLAQEPRRLYKRYADDLAHFLPALARQRCTLRRGGALAGEAREIAAEKPGWSAVLLGPHLTRPSLEAQSAFWQSLQARPAHWIVDCARLRYIDATGMAFLARWRQRLLREGHHLVLLAPPRPLTRALGRLQLADHFLVAADVAAAEHEAAGLAAARTVQRDGHTQTLTWSGEIIAANTEDVWHMTTAHVQAFGALKATLVIIDLGRLRFIDSSGAALMLRLKNWARSLNIELLYSRPQPNVRNVLRLTRLDQLLLEGAQ